ISNTLLVGYTGQLNNNAVITLLKNGWLGYPITVNPGSDNLHCPIYGAVTLLFKIGFNFGVRRTTCNIFSVGTIIATQAPVGIALLEDIHHGTYNITVVL